MTRDYLKINKNGVVCHNYIRPGVVGSKAAYNIVYGLEYRTTANEWKRLAEYNDVLTAYQCLRKANSGFIWRLIASNEIGRVILPKNWRPRAWSD